MAGKQHCRSFYLGVWYPGEHLVPSDIKHMFTGCIIILFVCLIQPLRRTRKVSDKWRETKRWQREGETEKMTAVTLEHSFK